MGATRIIQNNFVAGELAPELWGRHDMKAYFNGAATIQNFIPRRTGGLRKRAGTQLLYALDAVAHQVGNQFSAFPYVYNNTSCGIVYMYAVDVEARAWHTIYAGFIAIVDGTTHSVAPTALSISSTLNMTWNELPAVRSKQIGDTIFFTRNRKAAFKCVVTFNTTTPAASSIAFSMLAAAAKPATPTDLNVLPIEFKSYDKIVDDYTATPIVVHRETYGYTAATKKYALYGVKNGIFSDPITKSVSIYMPWSAGAYVNITFVPNWDAHDYYVLGKLNGSQYGIIGSFYPDGNFSLPDVVYVGADPAAWGTLSVSFVDSSITYSAAPAYGADPTPTGVAKKLLGDPDDTVAESSDRSLSNYAAIYKTTTVGTTRTAIVPQYFFTDAAGFTGGRARLCLGGTVNNAGAFAEVYANYVSGTPMEATVTPFNFAEKIDGTAGELIYYTPQVVTLAGGGLNGIDWADVALSVYDADTNPTGIRNTWGSAGADGCIKHIGFKIEYTGADTRLDDCLVFNGVAFDNATSGTFPTGDLVLTEAYDSLVYDLEPSAPEATYSQTGDYNDGTAYDITCEFNPSNATSDMVINSAGRYTDYVNDTKSTVSVTIGGYHKNSIIIDDNGALLFTWGATAATTSPVSLRLWTGALLRRSGGLIAGASPGLGDASVVKLYQKNTGGAYIEIGKWDVWMTYRDDPINLTVDTPLATGGTNQYKLKFANPSTKACVIRGIALVGTSAAQTFKDDNILAGTITGIQTALTVGDTNMDCRTMDVWQQRLVMASSTNLPFTVWLSTVGDLYNFYVNRPQVDSDAFSVTIPATKASKILHLVSGKWLTLFTESGEFVMNAGADGLSYRTVNIHQVSSVGIHPDIEPVQTEDRVIFVAHDGRSVYEMRYDLSQDSVIPIDRSILACHLTESATIVKAAYQRFPDSVAWFLLSDGTMLSMTFVPDQEVTAWARHTIAQPAGYAAGTLKCVDMFATGAILSKTGCEPTSEIMLQFDVFDANLVRQNKTVIERMRPNINTDTPTNLNARCSDHVGIANPPNVAAKLITLRPESPDFNTQGLKKSIMDVTVRARRTYSFTVVSSVAGMTAVSKVIGSLGTSTTTLATTDAKVAPRGYFNDDGQMEIASSDGKPCEILSLVAVLEVQQ